MAPGKGKGHKKGSEPPAAPTPGVSVTLRRGGDGFLYADTSGFDPGSLNADYQSDPAPGNQSTKGIGVALYTTDDDGTTSFPIAEQYILPDFPRTVEVSVWDDAEPKGMASATETYTS